MKIAVKDLRQGDRIQGLGLIVGLAVPQDDFNTYVEGFVIDREQDEKFNTSVILPNDHFVRVSRPFQVGDKVTVPNVDTEGFVDGYRVATVVGILADETGVRVDFEPDNLDSATVEFPFNQVRHAK